MIALAVAAGTAGDSDAAETAGATSFVLVFLLDATIAVADVDRFLGAMVQKGIDTAGRSE